MFWADLMIGIVIGIISMILMSVICISSRKNDNDIMNTITTEPSNKSEYH